MARTDWKWILPVSALVALGAVSFALVRGGGHETSTATNLVLISIDTLRADHLSSYGSTSVATPRIDRLAREGVLFENVQTTAPTTLPAHASLFTGLYPPRHRVRDNVGFYLAEEHPTLATILSEKGLRTGGFVGAFVLDARFGIARGFETYFDEFATGAEDLSPGWVSQRRGDEVLERAIEWLDERSGPFFAFLHFYDPHTPYQPPDDYAPSTDEPKARYRGEVAWVDSLVGRLLDWLDEHGRAEDTLVVLTSDHGEGLGEHGEKTHGFFLYEPVLRIPLLMRGPGLPQGERIAGLARIVDVAPTILELLGVPAPAGLDGRNLLSQRSASEVAYAETFLPRLHYGWSELESIRRGPFKLIAAPRSELYDLDADPGEDHNLFESRPEIARELQRELEKLTDASAPEPDALDEASRRRLRALGYIGGTSPKASGNLADPKDRIHLYQRLNDPTLSELAPEDGARFREAVELLREAIEEDPEVPRAYVLLGELLLKDGRAKEAGRIFERLVELVPGGFDGHFGLGMVAKALGRPEAAEAHFVRASEVEPKNLKSYFQLAEIARAGGQLENAERWLRRATAMHPSGGDRVLRERLAEVLIASGRSAEAEAVLVELVERQPDSAALYNLGQLRLIQGNAAAARELLERASELAPDDPDLRHALGNALAAQDELSAAVEAFRAAIERSDCFARAYSNLGAAYFRLGRLDEAVPALKRAIACDPDYVTAYRNLASIQLERGEVAKAIETLREAVRRRPDDEELARTLDELVRYQRGRR